MWGGDGVCPGDTKTECNKITPIPSNDFNLASGMLPLAPFNPSFHFLRTIKAGAVKCSTCSTGGEIRNVQTAPLIKLRV